jgi:hypothetical protein
MNSLQTLIEELRKIVCFKDTTLQGDLVLIVSAEPQLIMYALVDSIRKDESRKDDWWVVTMHLLSLPPQEVIWTLREPQFTGLEIFTMQGAERFVKAVNFDMTGMKSRSLATGTTEKNNPFSLVK